MFIRECAKLKCQFLVIAFPIVLFVICVCCLFFLRRRWIHLQLSAGKCKLPTVIWTPRFFNYSPEFDEDINEKKRNCYNKISSLYFMKSRREKMRSSTITNILPRMERLDGPYGMYATVYGMTKIVHVAHPIPARLILLGSTKLRANKNTLDSFGVRVGYNKKNRIRPYSSLGALKSPAYDHFKNFFGNGVFTSEGLSWKMKRLSVVHCLLKGCASDESRESTRLELEANKAADAFVFNALKVSRDNKKNDSTTDKHREEKGINAVLLLQRATIGLIYRLITHHNVDFHQSEQQHIRPDDILKDKTDDVSTASETDDEASQNSSGVQSIISNHPSNTSTPSNTTFGSSEQLLQLVSSYQEAVTNIRMIILAQSRSIWYLLPRWMYHTFSPMFREEEKMMVTIREFARIACRNAKPSSPLFLLRFRESHNPTEDRNIKNGSVTNKEILDEAITLLFAGQDTNAASLSWSLHLLSLYPHIQDRLVEEINSINEQTSSGQIKSPKELVTKKMISKMPYLDAVVKESMRLYPVAPFIVRKIPQNVSIPAENLCDESVEIPKGTLACIWIYGLHRNKRLWHRPNDFLPERWIEPNLRKLDPAQNVKKLSGAFLPFAAGPRNCLGQPLAHVISRIMLVKILKSCIISDKYAVSLRELPYDNQEEHEEVLRRTMHLRKDMQAGFTVFPRDLQIEISERLQDPKM